MATLGLLAGVLGAIGNGPASAGPTVDGIAGTLRLNEIQTIGTHNSYHLQPQPALLDAIRFIDPAGADQLEYSHTPLATQFGSEHVRQIELDVFADSTGGLLADPVGGTVVGLDPSSRPEMFDPGFKVLHIQDIDYETTCTTFVACLQEMESWSDANPNHAPIAVLVEVKDEPIPDPVGLGFVTPEVVGPAQLDALDAEIRSVMDPADLLTPDDVRGAAATLEDAVLTTGWPTLTDSAGRFLFLMDNGGRIRDDYRAGHPSLAGRVLFVSSEPGTDDAAFVKRNDPFAADIPTLVGQGYVVRTRADSPTFQARSGDTTQRDQALAGGARRWPTPRCLRGCPGFPRTVPEWSTWLLRMASTLFMSIPQTADCQRQSLLTPAESSRPDGQRTGGQFCTGRKEKAGF